MRKIMLLIVFMASVLVSNAQRKFKKGDYLKSTSVDQYIGTWEWKSGNDNFTIKFKKVKYHRKILYVDEDLLLGWFKYVKDGKIIENSIPDIGKDSTNTARAGETEQHVLLVTFTDINTKKTKTIIMELTSGNSKKAIWRTDPAYPVGITHDRNGIPTGDKWSMDKIE